MFQLWFEGDQKYTANKNELDICRCRIIGSRLPGLEYFLMALSHHIIRGVCNTTTIWWIGY